jgi:hypothetical protein
MRVSDYFNSVKWPQVIINILNVAFIPILSSQIAFPSVPLWRYTATKKKLVMFLAVPSLGYGLFEPLRV